MAMANGFWIWTSFFAFFVLANNAEKDVIRSAKSRFAFFG